jgi:hypothetical protein
MGFKCFDDSTVQWLKDRGLVWREEEERERGKPF